MLSIVGFRFCIAMPLSTCHMAQAEMLITLQMLLIQSVLFNMQHANGPNSLKAAVVQCLQQGEGARILHTCQASVLGVVDSRPATIPPNVNCSTVIKTERNLFPSDGEDGCLDQDCEQYDGPAIAVGHMHLVQPRLQQQTTACNCFSQIVQRPQWQH